jgi:hypothetical protein
VAGPAWSASAHVASAGVGAAATSIRDKIGRHCQPSSDWKWVGERERGIRKLTHGPTGVWVRSGRWVMMGHYLQYGHISAIVHFFI